MSEKKDGSDSAARMAASDSGPDIRLLVLDIDGTVVRESNRIRESVIQAIHSAQRRGVRVAVATGRLYRSSLHAYESLGSTLPLICYEGALIREPNTGFVHRHWPLETRIASQILDYLDRPSLGDRLSVHFYIEDALHLWNLNDASVNYLEGSKVEPIVVRDLRPLLNQTPTKVIVLSYDDQAITRLWCHLKNSYSRTQVRQTKSITVLEAFHPGANKGVAVSYLAENIMGLRPENVMAIGDDFNDVEMLEYAGIGVAMGNAPPAVKAIADWVAPTVEADGVVRAIQSWILQGIVTRQRGIAWRCADRL